MSKKEVLTKWETDGRLGVIYRVDDLMFWYSKNADPNFKSGQMLSVEEADESKPYKVAIFEVEKIPSDAFPSLTFSWGK